MISISADDRELSAAIRAVADVFGNTRPALTAIGEELVEFTKGRFALSIDPYGTPWLPNKPSTMAAYLRRMLGRKARTKGGGLSKRAQTAAAGKKPLIGESRSLSTQIHARIVGDAVEVRSTMAYAALQQFGGKKAQFPHLWGNVPPRPFFPDPRRGLPAEVSDRIREVLTSAVNAARR